MTVNEGCMNHFFKATQRLGLTLEMLFRAADVETKGFVYVEEFRMFLSKLKLGLSQAEINKLLHLFDEEWTGCVKKDDYLLCLAAYNVNSEKPNDKIRNLSQDSLMNFSRVLIDKRFSSEEAFKSIDTKKSGAFSAEQLSDFYKKLVPGISKKERAALFFSMDFEQTGQIEKSRFIDLIEKSTKVINDRLHGDDGFGTLTSSISGIREKSVGNEKSQFLSTIDKFEKKINGPFTKLHESLVMSCKNPETGINFQQVVEALHTFGDFLSLHEQFVVFRGLDINRNGNICFEDLIETFVEFKKKDSNYEFFIINLARNLQALNIQTEAYLSENNITGDTKLDEDNFCTHVSSIINIYKEDSKILFNTVCQGKKKAIYGYELINLLNSHRYDVDPKHKAKPTKVDDMNEEEIHEGDQGASGFNPSLSRSLTSKKTLKETKTLTKNQTKQLDEDDKKFNKLIDILKPKYEDLDFFELEGKKMQTIFNNYLACLKKFQIIK